MKITAIPADLQMVNFAVAQLEMLWERPEPEETELQGLLSQYHIDIDLEATEKKKSPSEFFVFMEIKVNQVEAPLPGYRLKVVGNGFFQITNYDSHPKEVIHNFKAISAVTMVLNALRAALSDMTSYGLIGRYNLPAIDILSLIKAKAAQEKSRSTETPIKGKKQAKIN